MKQYSSLYYNTRVKRIQTLLDQGELAEAEGLLVELCTQHKTDVELWLQLGELRIRQHKLIAARAAFNQVLAIEPDNAQALRGQAQSLLALGDIKTAEPLIQTLLTQQPDSPSAQLLRVESLRRQFRYGEALNLARSLREQPIIPASVKRQLAIEEGMCYLGRADYSAALAQFEIALQRQPNDIFLLTNKAACLLELGDFDTGLAVVERALTFDPDYMPAQLNQANLLAVKGEREAAQQALELIEQRSPHALRFLRLQHLHQPPPADSWPMPLDGDALWVRYYLRKFAQGDWQDYDTRVQAIVTATETSITENRLPPLLPLEALTLPLPAALQVRVAQARVRALAQHSGQLTTHYEQALPQTPAEDGRLRIGYVCGDIRDHPTAQLLRGVFTQHDRSRYAIHLYLLRPADNSRYAQDILAHCDAVMDCTTMGNTQAAERIRNDEIHVLVDLHGYTQHGRAEIFALRPAPVQVSYLAFPGSSGGLFWDYLIADTTVVPPEQQALYPEKLIYLPDSYQPNDNQQPIASTGRTRAQEGLPEDAFVYCCFNEAKKIDPRRFDLWMRLLQQAPNSVLWLYGAQAKLQANLRSRASTQGVAPERLVFARRRPKAEHLERLALADLFLDTDRYNAHTTASDALWAGLPLLTCPGEYFPSRVAASLLKAAGLESLVTATPEAYYALALNLAQTKTKLPKLRQQLAKLRHSSALFDTTRYTRNLEAGYAMAWARYQQGQKPDTIYVPGGK